MAIQTYGSLFSGVGGIDMGLDSADLQCFFQVEIDKNCQQILLYHWPDVPKYYDIKDVSGYDLPPVDLIAFGSPCQNLSTSGNKIGLNGEDSILFYEAIRIIKEMREKTNGQYPKWSIWENVTGALSSNGGADFGEVLHQMDEAGACFSEWAVLYAQYFGVPQRRRRIYLLSVYDPAIASRCPSKILPVKESGSGNPKKSVKQGKNSTTKVNDSLRRNSQKLKNETLQMLDAQRVGDVRLYNEPVQTLPARMGTGGNNVPLVVDDRVTSEIVGTLSARDFKGVGNQYVQEHKLILESSESIIGFSHTQGLDPQASTKAFPTLRAEGSGHAVSISKYVRRLTPIECERLMGWPDNHTLSRADGKINSDSSRYKMCGNGVASPVVKWIVQHIIDI